MKKITRRELVKRSGLAALLAALPAPLLAKIISEQPPVSTFGEDSTAEDVTRGLDLTGFTYVITGCNSGLGFETMRVWWKMSIATWG